MSTTTSPGRALLSRPVSPLPLMLALTFSTGIVDGVGYLGLDRVFTGNMTGNVVILGMGIAGADGLPILGPLLALAGFLLGAATAGRVLRAHGKGWTPATTMLLTGVAALLSVITIFIAFDSHPTRAVALSITAALGYAMGMQAGTARHVGVPDVSTVVVTSTITGLAADSWFGNRAGAHVSRRGTAVVLILLGAMVAALLLRWEPWPAVALSAIVTGVVTFLGSRS